MTDDYEKEIEQLLNLKLDKLEKLDLPEEYADDEHFCLTEQLRNFAMSILSPEDNKLCSSGSEVLQDMAVIESAYLSAKTGFPEEPTKVLQMAPGLIGDLLFEIPTNN